MRDERSFMLSLEVDEIDESASWAEWEALGADLARCLPARALVTMLAEFQHRLLERVCGPRWQPEHNLPAPFVCPNEACGADGDFARKGRGHGCGGSTPPWAWCGCGCGRCARYYRGGGSV